MFVCLFVYPTFATYYEITTDIYTPGLTLQTGDSLYMTNGGFGDLNLLGENVTATIKGTSNLVEGSGGIWELTLANNSHIDILGCQIHRLNIFNVATVALSGGLIEELWSNQWIPYTPGRDGVPVPNIKLYYSGILPTYNETTDILTGLWGNGTGFSIYLHDVAGYDPVIENIEFILIPEPATVVLLALGGLLIRRNN
jgi:hypothetical protein